jgi:predicted ATP-grasp superfamily ATP-dependent carboligase
MYSHPHMFCEAMTKHSTNLILDDTSFHAAEDEVEEALTLAKQADLVVMTNYYARIEKRGNNRHLAQALKAAGHTVVVVTNYPYIEGTTREADAVVCNFSGSPDSIRIAADLLFGTIKPYPSTKMPIVLPKEKELAPKAAAAPKKKAGKKPPARKGFVFGGKC